MSASQLRAALGPGLLMAGAAVGVSHLVQSTRAGAEYGLALLALVLLGCAAKYPFLEFGPRYAAATGEHLIAGYQRMGRWPLRIFALLTVSTMLIVLASVTLVTAGLFGALLGLEYSPSALSFAVLAGCCTVLVVGHYRGLDLIMKIIMAILALTTLVTVLLALGSASDGRSLSPA
ncbi:MAG: divalent metal cation transporter, partial [Wenzhouxiangellaceae bacterium]